MPSDRQAIATGLAELVAEVHRHEPLYGTALDELIDSALLHVPGAQHAGITMAHPADGISTVAATHRLPVLLDEIQQAHQEGPCVSAVSEHATMRSMTCTPNSGGPGIDATSWSRLRSGRRWRSPCSPTDPPPGR